MTIDEIRKAQEDGFRFAVDTYPGIAFYFRGPVTEWVEVYEVETDDEDGVHYHTDHEERETGMVYMIMVGDDYKHVIDPENVTITPDYCRVCGQIGCTHDGRER